MAQKLVIIGNGMAPGRMLEELFERAPGLYDVTIFNAEPRVNYDRIMLSPVLSGEKTYEDIIIHGDDWYEAHGVTLHRGAKVAKIDREGKIVTAENGVMLETENTLIARNDVQVCNTGATRSKQRSSRGCRTAPGFSAIPL